MSVDRAALPRTGSERDLLVSMIDVQRTTLLAKTEGLDAAGMRAVLPPSDITLAGLLKHMALVEADWFRGEIQDLPLGPPWDAVDWQADPDWEWRTAADDDPEDLRQAYRDASARSNEIAAGLDPDDIAARPSSSGAPQSVRWILLHMIEETARHAGHADLLRQSVDGAVGY